MQCKIAVLNFRNKSIICVANRSRWPLWPISSYIYPYPIPFWSTLPILPYPFESHLTPTPFHRIPSHPSHSNPIPPYPIPPPVLSTRPMILPRTYSFSLLKSLVWVLVLRTKVLGLVFAEKPSAATVVMLHLEALPRLVLEGLILINHGRI